METECFTVVLCSTMTPFFLRGAGSDVDSLKGRVQCVCSRVSLAVKGLLTSAGAWELQSSAEWWKERRETWEGKGKRWNWRVGGKADLPFLPAGCSTQPFIEPVQPAQTNCA